MKIYDELIIDIATGEVVAEIAHDFAGQIAECKGGGAPQATSPSGKIVKDLYKRGPLKTRLEDILDDPADDPYTQRQMDMLTQRTRAGYGARGLANSGIAVQGEQDSLRDFLLSRGEQKQGQAIQILGGGQSSPTFGSPSPPRGFMGLK